jgi:hypothetical protein
MYWLEPELEKCENRIYSQSGEDGVIEAMIGALNIKKGNFVELGVGPRTALSLETDGIEANTRRLKEQGWRGLWMDGGTYPAFYEVNKEWVTAFNINLLFEKYGVPNEFDLVSIDVDGQDPYIWMAIEYQPKIVIVECNGNFEYGDSRIMPFDINHVYDGTTWFGASVTALEKIGKSKGYVMVYTNAVNCFFVRRNLLLNPDDFDPRRIHKTIATPFHKPDTQNRPWIFI